MAFVDIVGIAKREAKGEATSDEVSWLHEPQNRALWIRALRAAIQDAQDQFSLQRERVDRARLEVGSSLLTEDRYRQIVGEYDAWVKKANRYRIGLEQRLQEIGLDSEMTEAERLRNAIAAHRHMSEEPHSDADRHLWTVLD